MRLILASRQSPLAAAQTRIVARALARFGARCEIVKMSSRGDEIAGPLVDDGGKELFVGALRRALQDGRADVAVHSLKDMPASSCGFDCIAVGFAEDPRDVFISPRRALAGMPPGATIGTCSPRRAALLREYFPRLRAAPMRGNIQTRLQKMQDGACDGVILAAAGLHRLNLISQDEKGGELAESGLHWEYLPSAVFVPAPGQGMLAAECAAERMRGADDKAAMLRKIRGAARDPRTELRRIAETEFAALLGGDCRTPLGAFAEADDDEIRLRAFYAGGGTFRRAVVRRPANEDGARSAAAAAAKLLKRQ